MMRNQFIFFMALLGWCTATQAQILETYPEGQESYKGGNIQFYKDFNRILKEQNAQPCSDTKEYHVFKVVVYPDSTIKYLKVDEDIANKQKCAIELSRQTAKYMKGWKPAEVNGEKGAAVARFWIIPHELFGDLPKNYDPEAHLKIASFDGGMNNFRALVVRNIDLTRFKFDSTVRLEVVFVIDREGNITELELAQSSGLKEFDDMVLAGISRIRKKWKPAHISNIPVPFKFRLPLVFATR